MHKPSLSVRNSGEVIGEEHKKIIKKQVQLAANAVIMQRYSMDQKHFTDPRYGNGIIAILDVIEIAIFDKINETEESILFNKDKSLNGLVIYKIAYGIINKYTKFCPRLINFSEIAINIQDIREKVGHVVLDEIKNITPENLA